jgi:hypothetical protein
MRAQLPISFGRAQAISVIGDDIVSGTGIATVGARSRRVGVAWKSVDDSQAHDLYQEYAAAVAYVAVKTPAGDESIGTAFHIGGNVWITARHVVEGNKIVKIGTTESSIANYAQTMAENHGILKGDMFSSSGTYRLVGQPMLHPEDGVDVAALKLDGPYGEFQGNLYGFPKSMPVPVVQLGGWLDDWIGKELVLTPVLVMGYPPVPFGRGPLLVATRAEINAVFDKRTERHPYFILSAMARPGFSGSLAITTHGEALGVTTESLVMNSMPAELGYFAVLAVEPIYNCLEHHHVTPDAQEFPRLLSE